MSPPFKPLPNHPLVLCVLFRPSHTIGVPRSPLLGSMIRPRFLLWTNISAPGVSKPEPRTLSSDSPVYSPLRPLSLLFLLSYYSGAPTHPLVLSSFIIITTNRSRDQSLPKCPLGCPAEDAARDRGVSINQSITQTIIPTEPQQR